MESLKILLLIKDKAIGESIALSVSNFCQNKAIAHKIYLAHSVQDAQKFYITKPDIFAIDWDAFKSPGKIVEGALRESRGTDCCKCVYVNGIINVIKTVQKICAEIADIKESWIRQRGG